MELLLDPAIRGLPHIFFKGAALTSECHKALGERDIRWKQVSKKKEAIHVPVWNLDVFFTPCLDVWMKL